MSRRGGFTLAEVIISVGLLSIGLLAVIGLFTSAIKMQNQLQQRDNASRVARDLLERICAVPGTVPDAPRTWIGGELSSDPYDAGPPAFPPAPYPFAEGFALDVYLDNSPRDGMKYIKVVSRWGNGKKLELQTLIPE